VHRINDKCWAIHNISQQQGSITGADKPTLSTCMAFMRSTKPSKDVFRISGRVCAGKVSLKCAEEYNLHVPRMDTVSSTTREDVT
jgi:hypothetical protein